MQIPKCSQCGGRMETGFIVEVTEGGVQQDLWAEGEAVFNTSLLSPFPTVQGRRCYPVTTYRCVICGRLESYALTKEERPAVRHSAAGSPPTRPQSIQSWPPE